MPAEYAAVLKTLARQGDYKDGVLRVNIPRNDLNVSVDGVATPTPFGFGGWIALTKGDHGDVMMGDLVLTENEVNPVMSAVLDNGLNVTALHNHFFYETPRIFYMHVHGHGASADIAKRIAPALGAHRQDTFASVRDRGIRQIRSTASSTLRGSRKSSDTKASRPVRFTRSRSAVRTSR